MTVPARRSYRIRYAARAPNGATVPAMEVEQVGRTPADAWTRWMGRCQFPVDYVVNRISVVEA